MRFLAWILVLFPFLVFGESPLVKNTWEIGFWSGGGSALSERDDDTNVFLVGARLGKVISKEHGKGLLKGNLEYVVEAVPAFLIFQKNTVYGFDMTPLLLKWNFSTSKNLLPYFELGAGMLFTSSDVPEETSHFNFTPQAGFGLHILTRQKQAVTFSLKYLHISNGGLESPNPGLNTIQFFAGYQWFK